MKHSRYLQEIFTPSKVVMAFSKHIPGPIAELGNVVFVGTGLSGTAALFILKQAGLINRLAIVRKGLEGTHSSYEVECSDDFDTNRCNWVFVDDMIDSGGTFREVARHFKIGKLMGAILYHTSHCCEEGWHNKEQLVERYSLFEEEDDISL